MRRIFLQVAAIGMVLWACGDDQGPGALGPDAVTAPIGTAGGTLVSKDGTLRVDIPAGALTSTRTITIEEIPASQLGSAFNGVSVSRAFELGPTGTTFDKPVKVSIRSAQHAIISDSMISVRKQALFTTEGGSRVGLDSTTMIITGDTVTIQGGLKHFSPLVLEDPNSSFFVDFRVTGVPPEAEVDQQFNIRLRASFRDESSQLVTQLIAGIFIDRSERIIPVSFDQIDAVQNRIDGTIGYKCPSQGLATHRGSFFVGWNQSNLAATDPGQRIVAQFQAINRGLRCVGRTNEFKVEFRGTGTGTVAGGSPSFTCDATCTKRLLQTAIVSLSATPAADSDFDGFSGQCGPSGVPGVMEPFPLTSDRLCIVTFTKKPTSTVTILRTGLGSGTVTGGVPGAGPSQQLDCGEKCVITVPQGASVELRSTPLTGSRLGGWGAGCGTTTPYAPVIVVNVNQPLDCTVVFPLEKLNIVVAPSSPTIDVGNSQRLNVVISDELGAVTGREVTFLSGNPSVATVDGEGNVTGVSAGLATIVTTVGGPGGGTVNTVVNVTQRTFALTVRKTGLGYGSTTLLSLNTGVSSDYCGTECSGTVTRVPDGSLMHILADPDDGSVLSAFLGDCENLPAAVDVAAVRVDAAKTCTVQFDPAAPPGPLSIAFGGLTSKTTGLSVALGSVNGTVYADYQLTNYRAADSMGLSLSLNGRSTGPCLPPSFGGFVRCEVNTARTDSSAIPGVRTAVFKNGARELAFRAIDRFGTEVATVSTPITITNQSFIGTFKNNPVGATSDTWRAGPIKITIVPVIFDDINTDNLSVTLTPSTLSGGGTLTLEGGPAEDPFTFTANPANSPTAAGRFSFTPGVFDGPTDITGLFGPLSPIEQNVDMVAPNVPFFSIPASTFISGGVLVLDFATGPYPAGERIALSRISGGSIAPVHNPNCASAHVHGTINIRRLGSSVYDGPFADPRNFANCGHGSIETEDFTNVLWSFGASITDASPVTTTAQMFQGVNGCDPAGPTFFDDIPILQGDAPGQSPFPSRTFTTNSFSGIFTLNVEGGMANDNICFRVNVHDSAVGPDGQPANNVNRLLNTTLRPFSVP